MFWLILAWVLNRTQLFIAWRDYGHEWSGFGAIENIRRREAPAPMAYRPLMAILTWPLDVLCRQRGWNKVQLSYEPIKIAMMAAALWSYHALLSCWFEAGWAMAGTLLAGALWTLTWLFDYWDLFPEWAALSLAIYSARAGWPSWAVVLVGAIGLLGRETLLLYPLVYLLAGGWIETALLSLAAQASVWLCVTAWSRFPKRYCEFFQWRQNREHLLKWWRGERLAFHSLEFTGLAWAVGSVAVLVAGLLRGDLPQALARTAWVAFLLLLGNWTVGLFREIRVSACAAIWTVPIILRWLIT